MLMRIGKKERQINNGFTLMELLLVIGIMLIILTVAMPIYSDYYSTSQLDDDTSQMVQSLRNAREFSVNGYNDSSYGVYFNTTSTPAKYVFFKGESFESRDQVFDREIKITSQSIIVNSFVNNQLFFTKGLGLPSASGTILLLDKSGVIEKKITINRLGLVDVTHY